MFALSRRVWQICHRVLCTAAQPSESEPLTRLSKAISTTGLYSRRSADQLIRDGRVRVNFDPNVSVKTKVTDKDKIFVDDIPLRSDVRISRPKIWMVHKLRGELVANYDMKNRPLLFSRLKRLVESEGKLVAVNKLEFNSEGLLLLTNNAKLARILEDAPKFERKYKVRVHGKLTPSKLDGLMRGLVVDGVKYRPIVPKFERTTGVVAWLTITCTENRKNLLQKCFGHLFLQPTRVISVQFGPYTLPSHLKPGTYMELRLTPDIEKLFTKKAL